MNIQRSQSAGNPRLLAEANRNPFCGTVTSPPVPQTSAHSSYEGMGAARPDREQAEEEARMAPRVTNATAAPQKQ